LVNRLITDINLVTILSCMIAVPEFIIRPS